MIPSRGLALAALLILSAAARAQEGSSDAETGVEKLESPTAINRRVTNPVSETWSLKLQNNINLLDLGSRGTHVEDTVQFQPTMPVQMSPRLRLIARPDFTLIDDKPYTDAAGTVRRTTGVGDTILDLVLSPRIKPWLFALGPTFVFPTANLDQTGQGKWQLGPAGVLGYEARPWLAGVIFQQWWSIGGTADRPPVSELHLQYLASYFFAEGWSVGTAPTIKVDWLAAAGERVTFPFGPLVAKVVKLGDTLPVKLELRGMYVPIHSKGGAEGIVQIIVTPVIPSLVAGPIFGRNLEF